MINQNQKKNQISYKIVFCSIYYLHSEQMITSEEKKFLKAAIFKEDLEIMKIINEFEKSANEANLRKNLLNYANTQTIKNPLSRRKSNKNSKTEISKPKLYHLNIKSFSHSILQMPSHCKGSCSTLEQDGSAVFKNNDKNEKKEETLHNFEHVLL